MATSGTVSYNSTRAKIIESAFRKIGHLGPSQTLDGSDTVIASDLLNDIKEDLTNDGFKLWTSTWQTHTLTASSLVTGTDSLEYQCIRGHTSAAADKPITGANYPSYWRAQSTAGSAWVTATAYTSINEITLADDFIGVDKAFIRNTAGTDFEPMDIISFNEYLSIANKYTTATIPTALAIQHAAQALKVYLWPYPSDTTIVLNTLSAKRMDDFTANGDNPDFPVRWTSYLKFALAASLASEYGMNDLFREYRAEAERLRVKASGSNFERTTRHKVRAAY